MEVGSFVQRRRFEKSSAEFIVNGELMLIGGLLIFIGVLHAAWGGAIKHENYSPWLERRCEEIRCRADPNGPLTPGPSPRWGEGKEDIKVKSLAPIGGEGGRRPGEGERFNFFTPS